MKSKYNLFIYFILSMFSIKCTQITTKNISIVPLKMLNYIDTMRDGKIIPISKRDFYLVRKYVESKATEKFIDSFVEKNKDKNLSKYATYGIVLYKESSETNIKTIQANPRVIDRYSQQNDMIYEYSWTAGKFGIRFKYKNGEIIEPKSTIIIRDIQESQN